ncbi:hypothetical protein [Microbacterium sp. BR1]|uniref:hypothetical protein n=1 Tax=Microbacterium sp. BR1 TaxID=1070896 RepID=UPI000C2BA99A|nr:hypothetical protein [Microbacterium sp. BR1]
MTAVNGWPAVSGAATFQDIRRALAGTVVKSSAGVLRKGILPISTSALLSGTATMVVNVATHVAVLDRNGAVFMPNEGVAPVTLSSAPVSGSRWSVLFDKQRETDSPFSDAADGPQIDKVESTSSLSAARALLPAGALELGYVQVDAGAANTLDVGVTITETVPYTAMEGGTVLVRNDTELQAWEPHDGSTAYRIDQDWAFTRIDGAWKLTSGVLPYADAAVTAGTITGGAWVTLALSSPSAAKGVTWSVGNPGRLTATVKGRYRAVGSAHVAASASASGRFQRSGATTFFESTFNASGGVAKPTAWADVLLDVGQYIEFQVASDTGGTLTGGLVSMSFLTAV